MASTRDQLFFPNFNPRKSWNRSKCLTHFLSYPNVRPVVVVGLCHLRHKIGRRLNEYKCDELNDWLMKCVIFCRDFSFARSFVALAFFNAMVFNYVKNKIPKTNTFALTSRSRACISNGARDSILNCLQSKFD